MRCLSPFARYSIQVFETKERVMQDQGGYAISVPLQKGVNAQFDKLGLLDHEADLVLATFNFGALPEGVHPLTRVGVFDTEAYCLDHYDDPKERAEMLAAIDKRLRELQEKFPSHFIVVDTPAAPKPWPTYDEESVEDILKLQERLAYSPELVRRYEEENDGREEIIEAMEALEATSDQHAKAEITVDA